MTPPSDRLIKEVRKYLSSLRSYARRGSAIDLYPYQVEAGEAILRSIREALGLTFVLMFPRQSGKDELLAQLTSYLMRLLSGRERTIIVVNPTYQPQGLNAIMRLESRLDLNPITHGQYHREGPHTRRLGKCRITFLSGNAESHVVGITASLLLIVNEAQDIQPQVYDRKFAPMCASTNATRIVCGTAWTSTTLLARELGRARLEEADGIQRVFIQTARDVRTCNPEYGRFVDGEVRRLGRDHPTVRSQFFCETIDAESGMFPPRRMALLAGDQSAQPSPAPGGVYAFLLDVAGQDEQCMGNTESPLEDARRDYTALSIVHLDLSSLESLGAPTFRVVARRAWQGESHVTIFGQLKALAGAWKPQHIVLDATGAGEGLWALMERHFPGRVVPFKFTGRSKSELGWRFLSVVETGRLRLCDWDDRVRRQYLGCRLEILPGPARTLRWGVPQGMRTPDGELVHDDHLMADALVAVLDRMDWHLPMQTHILNPTVDPLREMSGKY
jgi:hypothetical protein